MPSDKRKDSMSHRHRSHKGCWTCKRKRIQCDEMRPSCQQCSKRGITCEGYEIRLRWGAGIASRGRFNGAEKPVKESIPPHSKRRWDLRGKGEERDNGDKQGQPVLLLEQSFTPVSSFDQQVAERATVNILNVPIGQDPQDYIDINKHFELPASTESMRKEEAVLYSELRGLDTGYISTCNLSNRSALTA